MSDTSWYGRVRGRVRAVGKSIADAAWRRARSTPAVYLAGCVALALLGYAYLAAYPLIALAMLLSLPEAIGAAAVAADWLAIAGRLAAAAFGGTVTAYLIRLRFPDPPGIPITPQQAPRLFEELNEAAAQLGTRLPGEVRLTGESRIEWVRTPRLGFPVAFRHTLRIGLPSLQTLSAAQWRGALAAELGQSSLRRRPLIAWVCSLRPVWGQFRAARASGNWLFLPRLIAGFFAVYAPVYRYCTRLAACERQHDADRYALELINDEDVMQMLVASMLAERFLTRYYWPKCKSLLGRADAPDILPYTNLVPAYRGGLDRATAERWLGEALRQEQAPDAETASLSCRLEEIGHHAARILLPPTPNAAEVLLGPLLPAVERRLDRPWQQTRARLLSRRARASAAAGVSPTPAAMS